MSNILEKLGKELINKGNEPEVSDLQTLIKQNKIFGIFFYSSIIPNKKELLIKINGFIQELKNENRFKLIICICNDDKISFNLDLASFNNISSLVIPFESEIRNILINKYNIISLPFLLIIDKEGKKIDSLNSQQIFSLNKNTFAGWKNLLAIKKINKEKHYSVGDKGKVSCHPHLLFYVNYLQKSQDYASGNWYCDICRKSFNREVVNFYCDLCSYDLCDSCYEKNKKYNY